MKKFAFSLEIFAASLLVLIALGGSSCSEKPTKPLGANDRPAADAPKMPPKQPGEISLMAFNLENLFDNVHDEGKDDYTYLPESKKSAPEVKAACAKVSNPNYRRDCYIRDWNDKTVDVKLKNLSEVILAQDGGTGPDILIVEEVENIRILKQLNDKYLSPANYQTVILIEGPDERGIDIGLMSRLPVKGTPTLHKIPYKFSDPKDQERAPGLRGILEVPLVLPDGSLLTVFGDHFPSQQNPREFRRQTLDFLLKTIKDRGPKPMIVAGGDFNITAEEDAETGWVKNRIAADLLVSHLVGCQHCPGTHNYRGSWSFLDMLMFSKNLGPDGKAPWVLEPETIDVPRRTENHLFKGVYPRRFDEEDLVGVSDHFPIYARIKPRKK